MAQSMTFTHDESGSPVRGSICKTTITWVTDGAADGAPGESSSLIYLADGTTTKKYSGRLIKGITVPDGGGTQPDDNYNIIITDADGVNVLGNCSDDLLLRDDTNAEEMYFFGNDGVTTVGQHPAVCSALTVSVDTAGNDTGGILYLYWVRA